MGEVVEVDRNKEKLVDTLVLLGRLNQIQADIEAFLAQKKAEVAMIDKMLKEIDER